MPVLVGYSLTQVTSLHWLPVQFRVDFKVLVFVFKALHGPTHTYISDLLYSYSPEKMLRSSSQLLLTVPKSRLKSLKVTVLGPKPWNSLPFSIRSSPL